MNDKEKDREELYSLLAEGLQAVREGRTQPFDEAMAEIRKELKLDKQEQ